MAKLLQFPRQDGYSEEFLDLLDSMLDEAEERQKQYRLTTLGAVLGCPEGYCPQRGDCPNDHPSDRREDYMMRLFPCHECEFTGCYDCLLVHLDEPHWTDGMTSAERTAGIHAK